MRTDHSKLLNYYLHKIGTWDTPNCETCGVIENIRHMLCDCPTLEEARARNWHGKVSIEMMVTEPDVCRRILAFRYRQLKIAMADDEQTAGTNISM